MKFLLDESMEFRLVSFLQDLGHDVTAIAYDYPNALTDQEVLAIAFREGRTLLTNDRDFGELIFSRRHPHAGVIYFRLPAATVEQKLERLQQVLAAHSHEPDRFFVVTEHEIRAR